MDLRRYNPEKRFIANNCAISCNYRRYGSSVHIELVIYLWVVETLNVLFLIFCERYRGVNVSWMFKCNGCSIDIDKREPIGNLQGTIVHSVFPVEGRNDDWIMFTVDDDTTQVWMYLSYDYFESQSVEDTLAVYQRFLHSVYFPPKTIRRRLKPVCVRCVDRSRGVLLSFVLVIENICANGYILSSPPIPGMGDYASVYVPVLQQLISSSWPMKKQL
jgi:hypothetical protein